jgi:hypothetical protein
MFLRLLKDLAEKEKCNGKAQGRKSDAVGTAYEQYP